jgi:hypothetical protein
MQLANVQKNYQNALTMDAEDDYMQKQLSFGGIAEVMKEIRMQIASDLRMPLTKIFGISAAGFSSGEDDIENYNAMVESQIRAKCKYELMKVVEIRSQKMFGITPDDLEVEFKTLRMLSAEQEETVKTSKFNRILAAKGAGLISILEFKEACNKDALLPIQLDTTVDMIEMERDEVVDEHENLVKTLSDNPEDKAELEKQKSELAGYKGEGKEAPVKETAKIATPKHTAKAAPTGDEQ